MNLRLKPTAAGVVLGLVVVIAPASSTAEAATSAPTTLVTIATPSRTSLVLPVSVQKFKNCTALNKKYPHGVGKATAKDKVSGKAKPVTNFKRDNALYLRNRHLDRDNDGVACEQR